MDQPTTFDHVTCPFCGLACDDLRITREGDQLTLVNQGLSDQAQSVCAGHFAEAPATLKSAQIKGQDVTHEQAIAEAARLIDQADHPLMSGSLLDVSGSREAIRLALQCSATVDHVDGDSAKHQIKVLQNTGLVTASLSEVRARADFIVIIGDQLLNEFPRLSERILTGERPFHKTEPQYAFIGPQSKCIPDELRERLFENIDSEDLARSIQNLAALNQPTAQHLAQSDDNQALMRVLDQIKQSDYPCILWSSADLPKEQAGIISEGLALLLRELNQKRRCVGIPLGNNAVTFNNACMWQTASPIRTAFGAGRRYDLESNTTAAMLAENSADLLIWSAVIHNTAPPQCAIPTIVIARSDITLEQPADVFIPVGIPGIDGGGHICRTDSVVILPLKQLREAEAITATQVFAGIRQQLKTDQVELSC